MRKLADFDPLVASLQAQTLVVDFGAFLPSTVTLIGVPTITITVNNSEDDDDVGDDASAKITAGPSIGTLDEDDGGTGSTNFAIYFQLSGLDVDVMYLLVYSCSASNGDVVAAYNHIRGVEPE